MRTARRLVVACTVTALIAVAACESGSDTDAADADSGPQTGSIPTPTEPLPDAPEGLEDFYDQDLTWEDCTGNFECTTIEVPLDYAEPEGQTVGLAVSRRPADEPGERRGALLVNPGGPGGSGVEYAPTAVGGLNEATLRRYDVVGFDPRGVAGSEGIDCVSDQKLDEYIALDPSPDNPRETSRTMDTIADFGQSCVDNGGPLAAHMSTTEVVRDMDIIRSVLASPKLHYYGASYGTLLGATYAELFPDNVGKMVLDAAVDPSLPEVEAGVAQAAGFETAVQAYFQHCIDQGDCPLGDSVDEASQTLRDLLARIDEEPLPTDGNRQLRMGNAIYGVFLPLYVSMLWPQLTDAIADAQEGDGTALLQFSDLYVRRGANGYQNNTMEALPAVNCLDSEGLDLAPARVRELVPRFEQASPTFGDIFAWSLLSCHEWPVETSEPLPEITGAGAPPIMVIGGTRDPATPYEFSEGLAEQLESGVLVTRDGDGHGSFAMGYDCIDELVNKYFAEDEVPEEGTRCG